MNHYEAKIEKDIISMLDKVLNDDDNHSPHNQSLETTALSSCNSLHQRKEKRAATAKENSECRSNNFLQNPFCLEVPLLDEAFSRGYKRIKSGEVKNKEELQANLGLSNYFCQEELNQPFYKLFTIENNLTRKPNQGGDDYILLNENMNETERILEACWKNGESIDLESFQKLQDNLFTILTTQNCSRIFQKCLKNTNTKLLSYTLQEIQPRLGELMVDQYANYFCQKMFGYLNPMDRLIFLQGISDKMVKISNNKIGTYPLQAIIEKTSTESERMLILEGVVGHLPELCVDPQGVHVIEKIIGCFQEETIPQIIQFVVSNFWFLTNHANGLCVAKKLVMQTKNIQIQQILQKILFENALVLVQHTYGNYVIQVAFDAWGLDSVLPIIRQLYGKLPQLSMQKFSSNVIEKAFEKAGQVSCLVKKEILYVFLNEASCMNRIVELMKNSYGNYVVQKALKLSTGITKLKMVSLISSNIHKLGEKKLIFKWNSILHSCFETDRVFFSNLSIKNNCIVPNFNVHNNNNQAIYIQPSTSINNNHYNNYY